MNLKKFSIISLIIIGIIAVTTIVLSCVKVNNPLEVDNPSKIIVYAESSSALVTCTEKDRPSDYKKLVDGVKDMTNLSIFECMLNDYDLKRMASQNVDKEYPSFSKSTLTSNNHCIELIFENKQEIIISCEGDTKVIEFYALIFTLEKSTSGQEIELYYSTSTDEYKTYTKTPILINAKTNKLLKLVKSIDV